MNQTEARTTTMMIVDGNKRISFFLRTILTFISVVAQLSNVYVVCPSKCKCEHFEGRLTTDCSNTGMTNVPSVPKGTMSLKMDGNKLDDLRTRYYFANKSSLTDVLVLSLRNCNIRQFRVRAFWGLNKLLKLDLAQNEINKIPIERRQADFVGPFADMTSLKTLDLSYNKLVILNGESFQGLTSLEDIDLSHNNISLVTGDFSRLVRLRRIFIQSNKLKRINVETFFKLTNLNVLNLVDNPYVCDCSIRKFVKWQQNKYLTEPPTCAYPLKLQGKRWDQIKLDEFACPPQLEPKDNKPVMVRLGQSVTFACLVKGDPRPEIEWKFYNATGFSMVIQSIVNKYSFNNIYTSSKQDVNIFNLTILSVDPSSIGLYQCIGTNFADKDDVIFKLELDTPKYFDIKQDAGTSTTIATKTNDPANIVIIGLVLGATISILTALLLIVICYRRMERERNATPVRQLQNGYGYHIIDSDAACKFVETRITPNSTRSGCTIRSQTSNNIVPESRNDSKSTSRGKTFDSEPQLTSDSAHSSPKSRKDIIQHKQRTLRFAVNDDLYDDEMGTFKNNSMNEHDNLSLDVRETEI